jgi:hypothetical protein
MHYTLLVDTKCVPGIQLFTSDDVENAPEKHPDVQAFDRALEQGRAGTLDKSISGTFTGVFFLERAKGRVVRLIKVETITDLKVSVRENVRAKTGRSCGRMPELPGYAGQSKLHV